MNTPLYKKRWTLPIEQQKRHKQVVIDLNDHAKEGNRLVDEVLTPYVRGRYGLSDPDLVAAYMGAIELDSPPSFKRALTGMIREKESGNPLKGVWLSIDGEEAERHGGESGAFYVSHMDAGEHDLRFELTGFHPVELKVLILAGKTTKVDIEMELISLN